MRVHRGLVGERPVARRVRLGRAGGLERAERERVLLDGDAPPAVVLPGELPRQRGGAAELDLGGVRADLEVLRLPWADRTAGIASMATAAIVMAVRFMLDSTTRSRFTTRASRGCCPAAGPCPRGSGPKRPSRRTRLTTEYDEQARSGCPRGPGWRSSSSRCSSAAEARSPPCRARGRPRPEKVTRWPRAGRAVGQPQRDRRRGPSRRGWRCRRCRPRAVARVGVRLDDERPVAGRVGGRAARVLEGVQREDSSCSNADVPPVDVRSGELARQRDRCRRTSPRSGLAAMLSVVRRLLGRPASTGTATRGDCRDSDDCPLHADSNAQPG